jgi:hypothetical protein
MAVMITTELLTEKESIERIIPECIRLAEAEKAPLPFQYMHMPLLWWETFRDTQNALFWQKRGKNFLGMQSRLERFFVLVAMNEGAIRGAMPLVQYAVKIPAEHEELHIVTLAGDYVLHPFQDIVVDHTQRQPVLAAMLERIADLLKNDSLLFWAGYIPEGSQNLNPLRKVCQDLKNQNIQSMEAVIAQKGGVWPWTIGGIGETLKKIISECEKTGDDVPGLAELVASVVDCTPQSLLFPRTRIKLQQKIEDSLLHLKACGHLDDLTEKLESLLEDTPMLFPYIELADDREKYLGSLSYSTRRYFRRYMKKYFEAGGSFETVLPHEITEDDIEDYIHLHLLRWGKGSASICGEAADYHRRISKAMARQGLFLLFFARYQGRRIAVHSCFDIGGRREGYITGVDPEFEELRAGRLLYLQTIYDAIDKGLDRYELGAVGFDYKMSFVQKSAFAHSFFVYPENQVFNPDQIFLGFECVMPVS